MHPHTLIFDIIWCTKNLQILSNWNTSLGILKNSMFGYVQKDGQRQKKKMLDAREVH